MNKIRDTVVREVQVPCTWALPDAPDGKRLDPSLVNVGVTLAGVAVPVGQVNSAAQCANVDGGWFYDDPVNPSEIRTCPKTCTFLDGNPDGLRVTLQFGCETRKAIIQ